MYPNWLFPLRRAFYGSQVLHFLLFLWLSFFLPAVMAALLCCYVLQQPPCNELCSISLVYIDAELLPAENGKQLIC